MSRYERQSKNSRMRDGVEEVKKREETPDKYDRVTGSTDHFVKELPSEVFEHLSTPMPDTTQGVITVF